MKLILAEKPSTARILAHVVGAREKIYSKIGKAFCYFGNGYYVVNARGHLYGLGEPEDYGYSKKYNIEELPMFPDFKIFPCGEDTEDLRNLISEIIFRHIYEANHRTNKNKAKPYGTEKENKTDNICYGEVRPQKIFAYLRDKSALLRFMCEFLR